MPTRPEIADAAIRLLDNLVPEGSHHLLAKG
jgi:hypothetical protein